MHIRATTRTPEVTWDQAQLMLCIRGTSIPENAHAFYKPVVEFCKTTVSGPDPCLTVRVDLRYFNSSSLKSLFTLLEPLRAMAAQGRSANVEWTVEDEDEFMQESGETLRDMLGIPFRFVPVITPDNGLGQSVPPSL